jgi:hypothetical protein
MNEEPNGPDQPEPPAAPLGDAPAEATPAPPEGAIPPPPTSAGFGGGWGQPAPPPGGYETAPAPPKRRWGLLVGVVVLAVVVVAAIIAFAGGGGSALPDSFAGAERVNSGPVADFLEQYSSSFDQLGVDMEFAVYGSEINPSYMILTMQGDAVASGGGTGSLTDQFEQGFASGFNAQLDESQAVEDTVDGVYYVCMPAVGQQVSSGVGRLGICLYQDDDMVAMVMSIGDDQLHELLDQTKDLHDQLA